MRENKHNQEVDALRAVAIIFVLFHHYQSLLPKLPPDWYRYVEGLWSGVDLFFCISGYVIAKSLIPKLENLQGREFWEEAISFWLRRCYRILPSAWLWAGGTFLMAAWMAHGDWNLIAANLSDLAAAVFQVANLHYLQCTVDPNTHCGVMSIYWSLSLEEQFYIVLPFAVLLFRKKLPIVLLVLIAAQLFLSRNQWQGLSAFIRTDAIMLGVMLAWLSTKDVYKYLEPIHLSPAATPFLATVLIAGIGMITTMRIVSFHVGLVAMVCAVTLWLASYDKEYLLKKSLLRDVLVKIGERSFSIYLIHQVAFATARVYVGKYYGPDADYLHLVAPATLIAGIVLLAVLVELNYRYVETPWRLRGKKAVSTFATEYRLKHA